MAHVQRATWAVLAAVLIVVGVGCANSERAAVEPQAGIAKTTGGGQEMLITGRCHCGDVAYEARGPIIKCSTCDCRGCRKTTGTLKAPFVTVARARFKVTAGVPATYQATSGDRCDAHGVWHFCPRCGSPVFWLGHKGDEVDLFAGSLDDVTVFRETE